MMDTVWTFMQTLGKGILQGVKQFISNDLQDYVPLFILAAIFIIATVFQKIIKKIKNR